MSRDAFLQLPEEKPYLEYIDGVVRQKPMVNRKHHRIVQRLDRLFDEFIDIAGGDGGPEATVDLPGSGNYQLPDTAYWAPGTPMTDGSIPTVVVEVRSPSQTLASLRRKCGVFLAEGVLECWLIDPEARTFEVITQAGSRMLAPSETLTSPGMPGFELDLAALFAVLDR